MFIHFHIRCTVVTRRLKDRKAICFKADISITHMSALESSFVLYKINKQYEIPNILYYLTTAYKQKPGLVSQA